MREIQEAYNRHFSAATELALLAPAPEIGVRYGFRRWLNECLWNQLYGYCAEGAD